MSAPGMSRAPDFLCIGAQKAATTWLYAVLGSAQGVFLPAIKELNFFLECHPANTKWAKAFRHNQVKRIRSFHFQHENMSKHELDTISQLDDLDADLVNDGWYRSVFKYADNQDICGDISPSYMCMPQDCIEHVNEINPGMKILLIVRDPLDRTWSQIRMNNRYGLLDFELDGIINDDDSLELFMEYSSYASSIPRWRSITGDDRFHAIEFDRIKQSPRAVLDEVCEFIGAEPTGVDVRIDRPMHSGDQAAIPPKLYQRLFAELEPQYEYLHTMFPVEVQAWIDRHGQALGR